ncbi:MAG: site-2 protease family protein [Burkholderiales bacterium]|nr:site-2 protease family protein [Burkholderiales bacterium]
MESAPATAVLAIVPVVLAIVLHEAAHGYVARLFGDETAWQLGRVTLNPLKHIDLIGTLVVPGLLLVTGAPYLFGWAKPVPVNFANLRHPKRDMIWVAAAGPGANFAMALLWMLLAEAATPGGPWASEGLFVMARIGVSINLVLMVLNLLPIPPLDGGRIAVGLLPERAASVLARIEPFGFVVIVTLLVTGLLSDLMRPLLRTATSLLYAIVGS